MMAMKSILKISFLALGCLVLINACKKEERVIDTIYPEAPFNPYDTIDRTGMVIDPPDIDSNSFLGLHTYIFSQRCAVPACHDGSFEPDFRTVQSAYSTLVYHPVIKNTSDSAFTYRVQPGNAQQSWLYERITTNDPLLGRMPLYDNPLTGTEINRIKEWINSGAKDFFGNSATYPNYQPALFGVAAYLPNAGNMRVDTIRLNNTFLFPFVVPANTDLKLWIGLYDTKEDGSFEPANNLTYNKIRFSVNDMYDFSNATEMNLTKDLFPTFLPVYLGPPQAPYFHHITINTAQFQPGDIVYIRVYVQDANHSSPTELPDQKTHFYLQTFFAFAVQ